MTKKVVIMQARMGSTRLPGKVLKTLHGKSVLAHGIERCLAMKHADVVVIATTDGPEDDLIVQEAERLGVPCFRGSERDVLSRYYGAARAHGADVVIRVTSDCPLLDHAVADDVVERFLAGVSYDYLSNTLERSFPRGLDTEVFTMEALATTMQEAEQEFEREHVTPFLYRNSERFHVGSYAWSQDLSRYRWTLDTQEDWELISAVYDRLYEGKLFGWREVLALMEREPELTAINAHVEQKKLGE
ncbi:glycosyltransferase family protein [Tumebacillus sp. ITR2]|uniref:Glycosyltransferase family protein n=1 Tax=Tumebacillus amylolyticus TaxID=2801339 RepID=A0ABS1J5H8_9BACL|nr:glycosyltransferase family protein [Tumebacillus amylolyticus]MBL0385525.1 glycosyltransferase family protein [Tumebacillus amylolyticus]